MASRSHPGQHLDALAGREVVFCHACSNEWYRDEHDLRCPACESDIIEIVSPDNDPREINRFPSVPTSPTSRGARHDEDLDPDEADIEEYVGGPHGFVHRRSVRMGSQHVHHHETGVEPVLHRFYEIVQNFGQERNSSAREPQNEGSDDPPPWPRIHRATFTSGPFGGGTASVTIFSGPPPAGHGMGFPHDGTAADPFQAIFNVLRDLGPPHGDHQGAPPQIFARGLQEMLSLFSGAHGAAGDAVYSQEALDRIITQLMEANPQSNAAPPASEEALKTLRRKAVDQDMLKGESKTECTICLDEMKVGDEAVFLPCKHWFHDECVTLWLKEHNTCPICRTPIESNNDDNQSSHGGGGAEGARPGAPRLVPVQGDGSAPGHGGEADASSRSFRGGFSRSSGGGFGRLERESTDAVGGSASRSFLGSRPVRLDEACRAISTIREERDGQRGRGPPSQHSHGTSRMQRRTSISPTSPRETLSGEYGARMRQRSPSQSSRRGQGDGGPGRQASQGPLSWLRGRFAGGGGSYQGPSRDERRY